MNYKQFHETINYKLTGVKLSPGVLYRGSLIQQSPGGDVYVDQQKVAAGTISEAKQAIDQQVVVENIRKQLREQEYDTNLISTVAGIVASHKPGIKITDTLIERYIHTATTKQLSADPVVLEVRQKNVFDNVLDGYLDFILEDGSTVIVSDQTCATINNVFGKHADVIAFMAESKDNFLDVVNQLKD